MSVKYHTNPNTGNVARCGSTKGMCPYGADAHFDSREEAQAAYEARMAPVSEPMNKESMLRSELEELHLQLRNNEEERSYIMANLMGSGPQDETGALEAAQYDAGQEEYRLKTEIARVQADLMDLVGEPTEATPGEAPAFSARSLVALARTAHPGLDKPGAVNVLQTGGHPGVVRLVLPEGRDEVEAKVIEAGYVPIKVGRSLEIYDPSNSPVSIHRASDAYYESHSNSFVLDGDSRDVDNEEPFIFVSEKTGRGALMVADGRLRKNHLGEVIARRYVPFDKNEKWSVTVVKGDGTH